MEQQRHPTGKAVNDSYLQTSNIIHTFKIHTLFQQCTQTGKNYVTPYLNKYKHK